MNSATQVICLLALLSALLFVSLFAEDGGNSGPPSHEGENGHVTFSSDSESISIEVEVQNAEDEKNYFHFEFDGSSSSKFKAVRKSDSGEQESDTELRVEFMSVVEYAESGLSDSGYNVGEDAMVRTTELTNSGSCTWAPLVCSESTHTNGTNWDCYRSISCNDVGPWTLTFSFHYTDFSHQEHNIWYSPSTLKFDIDIIDYVYANGGNRLALQGEVRSKSELHHEEVGENVVADNSEWQTVQNSDALALGWAVAASTVEGGALDIPIIFTKGAECGPDSGDVKRTDLGSNTGDGGGDEQCKKAFFSFDHAGASSIYWDPLIGEMGSMGPNWLTIAGIAAASAVVLAGAAFVGYKVMAPRREGKGLISEEGVINEKAMKA